MLLDPETWRQAPYQQNQYYGQKGGLLDSFFPQYTPPTPRPVMPRAAPNASGGQMMQPQPFIGAHADNWDTGGGNGLPPAYAEANGGEFLDMIKNLSKYTPSGMAMRGIGSLYDAFHPMPAPSIGTGATSSGWSGPAGPMPKANGMVEILSRSPNATGGAGLPPASPFPGMVEVLSRSPYANGDDGTPTAYDVPQGLEAGQDTYGGATAPNGQQFDNPHVDIGLLDEASLANGYNDAVEQGWNYNFDTGEWELM